MDETCVALGTFDGIHLGHQALIRESVRSAREKGMRSVVVTFDVLPLSVIAPDTHTEIIIDNNLKSSMIEEMGVDYLIFLKFTKEFAMTDGEEFLSFLTKKLNAKMLICGYNYSFGKYGRGNGDMLDNYKDKLGYELKVFEPVKCNGQEVSSTIIREKLMSGDVEEGSRLLGYRYFYSGFVDKGKGKGTSLGFPTANLFISDNMAIRNGIYITYTYVNNIKYKSICNIGYAPTFGGRKRCIEIYLLGFKGNLYGKGIKTEFIKFIRPERKFNSEEELKKQVFNDINCAEEYFSAN
jgi:riboflavin kinase/FMN adenylyltransferase